MYNILISQNYKILCYLLDYKADFIKNANEKREKKYNGMKGSHKTKIPFNLKIRKQDGSHKLF